LPGQATSPGVPWRLAGCRPGWRRRPRPGGRPRLRGLTRTIVPASAGPVSGPGAAAGRWPRYCTVTEPPSGDHEAGRRDAVLPITGWAQGGNIDGRRVALLPARQRVDGVDLDEAVAPPEHTGALIGRVLLDRSRVLTSTTLTPAAPRSSSGMGEQHMPYRRPRRPGSTAIHKISAAAADFRAAIAKATI
jgi:hypothetical protein